MNLPKFELDVMQANELDEATNLAVKHQLAALVVHPSLSSEAIFCRGRRQGRYKLITPIDWPKGENYAMTKMRGLSADSLATDGFEIMLSGTKSMQDIRKEAKTLTDFIRTHVGRTAEVRFVLGALLHTEEQLKSCCEALLDVPTPAMVRTDIHLKHQVSKINADSHQRLLQSIHGIIRVPVKLSGNINQRVITTCPEAVRYAVNLQQLKTVLKEMAQVAL